MILAIPTLASIGGILTWTAVKQIRTTIRLYRGTYDWHELTIRGQANNVALSFALGAYAVLYWVSLAIVLL